MARDENTRRLRTLDVYISPLHSRVLFCSRIIARLCSFDHFISWIKHETNWRTWGFVLGPFSEFRRSLSKTPNREFVKRGKTVFSNIQFIKIPIKTTEQGHTSGEGKMHVLLTYEYKLNWCENGKYHAISTRAVDMIPAKTPVRARLTVLLFNCCHPWCKESE